MTTQGRAPLYMIRDGSVWWEGCGGVGKECIQCFEKSMSVCLEDGGEAEGVWVV